jgi:thioredoxin-related protein
MHQSALSLIPMKKSLSCLALITISLVFTASLLKADEGAWLTDSKKAFAEAKAEKKYVMIDFSGVTWCKPCMALQAEVFSTKEFQNYAKSRFVLVRVDFPDPFQLPKSELIDKYLPEVLLPTVVITSADGKKLGQTGYAPGGPVVFIESVQKIVHQ